MVRIDHAIIRSAHRIPSRRPFLHKLIIKCLLTAKRCTFTIRVSPMFKVNTSLTMFPPIAIDCGSISFDPIRPKNVALFLSLSIFPSNSGHPANCSIRWYLKYNQQQ
jgi:hypothetical protein